MTSVEHQHLPRAAACDSSISHLRQHHLTCHVPLFLRHPTPFKFSALSPSAPLPDSLPTTDTRPRQDIARLFGQAPPDGGATSGGGLLTLGFLSVCVKSSSTSKWRRRWVLSVCVKSSDTSKWRRRWVLLEEEVVSLSLCKEQ